MKYVVPIEKGDLFKKLGGQLILEYKDHYIGVNKTHKKDERKLLESLFEVKEDEVKNYYKDITK
jgi:hypothetical protein